jgi:CubicO group peptidase (beta-lactamase class C family)
MQMLSGVPLLLSWFVLFGTLPHAVCQTDPSELAALFDKVIAAQLDEYRIPGAAVAVVSGGNVIFQKGYGYSDLINRIPVDPARTLFRVGSVSKLFTWMAIMQLAERGLVDLETDVNEYLDFEIPTRLIPGNVATDPAPITLSHLMTHTPGFEDISDGLFFLSPDKALSLRDYIHSYLPARAFPSGEVMAYSNYGSALAGYIVELVSGVSFPEYIEQNIYVPLGMNRSTLSQPLPDELSRYMFKPYRFVDGHYLAGGFEFMPGPAGGMSCTVSDMTKFMVAHLQGGRSDGQRILEGDTIDRMHSRQFSHHPELDGMTLGFHELSFYGRHVLFHGGSTFLFHSGLYLLPEENVGVFVSYGGGNHLVPSELFHEFMNTFYPVPSISPIEPAPGAAERSKKYAGEYHSNRRNFTGEEKVLSLMNTIQVDTDAQGYLLVTHLGERNRFTEVEPGIYRNPRRERMQSSYGAFSTIVFGTDPFGRIMLKSDGPMTYSKAPWYATGSFTGLTVFLSLILIIGSFFYWIIRYGIRIIKRQKLTEPGTAALSRLVATIFGFLTFVYIMGLMQILQIDPVYGVPMSAFGIVPEWSRTLDLLPLLITVTGAAIVVFVIVVRVKRYWKLPARFHYTLFGAAVVALLLTFRYWNIF